MAILGVTNTHLDRDLSCAIWVGFGVLFVWRQLAKLNKLQVSLHRGASWLGLALQWHTLFLAGCAAAIFVTLLEYFYRFFRLDHNQIKSKLTDVYNAAINEGFRETFEKMVEKRGLDSEMDPETYFLSKMEVPGWLTFLNALSMCCGLVVFIVVTFHVYKLIVLPSRNLALQHPTWKHVQWAMTKRANWLLVIILMPLAFIVAVMRANCRLWGLLTGQSPHVHHTDFEVVESSMFAEYYMDLELAAICQFAAVWSFARITGAVLSDTNLLHQKRSPEHEGAEESAQLPSGCCSRGKVLGQASSFNVQGISSKSSDQMTATDDLGLDAHTVAEDYKTTILYAGFLGVWAYVLVGGLRSLLDLVFCLFRSTQRFSEAGDSLFTVAYSTMTTIFSVFTMLCIVNMIIICHSPIVKHRLGEANLKFLGTRILLLVLDVQQKVLDACMYSNALWEKMEDKDGKVVLPGGALNVDLASFKHSEELGKLKNLTFLNFWILLVALLNLALWWKMDLQHSGFAKFKPIPELVSSEESSQLLQEQEQEQRQDGHTGWIFHKEHVELHDDDPWDF